jgi:hypothetical protein
VLSGLRSDRFRAALVPAVRPRPAALPDRRRVWLVPAALYQIPRQASKPCPDSLGIGLEHLLRDLQIDRMIAGIIGKMEFERAVFIDARIGKAQRKGAGRAALMQAHLAPSETVYLRLVW